MGECRIRAGKKKTLFQRVLVTRPRGPSRKSGRELLNVSAAKESLFDSTRFGESRE